jgi:CelD/BcsL family acetyltransferase involved in cellulose biosynthesis
MSTVTCESFDSLHALRNPASPLVWTCPFVLPEWMSTWWQHFAAGCEPYLISVRDGEDVLGVAPLKIDGGVASIVGSDNVCDYVDLIVQPGREEDLCNAVLDELKRRNVKRLNLGLLRPDSVVMEKLAEVARARGAEVSITPEDVSAEMDLPDSFEGYLALLNTKQRHEVRRKLRRLHEAGKVEYRLLNGETDLNRSLDRFMHLFSLARDEKARFMTPEMESFFRSLAAEMAGIGLLRLGQLDFDGLPVAMVMCFDYNDSVYLYNSGFDPQYDSLSVGLLSKVFCIEQSIQQGKKRFEFLKGNEIYKQRLGGKEISLSRCQIAFA